MIDPLASVTHAKITMGENCRIDAFAVITGDVKLGDNVHIGTGVSIHGGAGVGIGNDSAISPGARIFTATFDRETRHLGNPQTGDANPKRGPVRIGERCIIGANSVVLPGVAICDDVQVGALSLVRASIEKSGIYAGTPAQLLYRTWG